LHRDPLVVVACLTAVISGERGWEKEGWLDVAGKFLPASSHLLAQVGRERKRQI